MKEMGGLILRNDGGIAYNRAYLAPLRFAQICSADAPQTSDIRKALAVIAQKGGIGHKAV